jgi:SNF2 family DNA or RNA helicase
MSITSKLLVRGVQTLLETFVLNLLPQTDHSVATQTTQLKRMPQKTNSILTDYHWPGKFKPFAHQKQTSEFLTLNRRAFCFNEQGTGKTASVIWACDYLMDLGIVNRVLVICPLSIMKSAWQADLFKFAIHRTCDVAYGEAKRRTKLINNRAEFVIINYDGVEIVKDAIINGGFDLIVVDEASAYKNAQTSRWKTLRDIAKTTKGMWMLTGTPAAQSPVDAFGLAKMINPKNTPKFFGQFRDSVMYKISNFKWTPKPQAQSIVHQVLQPAIRFEKAQCLDLPSVTFVERDAPLTPQQIKYYTMLKKQMTISAGGEQVTSVNAAVNINKLLQISGGAVYTDTGEVVEFDVSNRLNVLQEVINEASHKVLLFVPFTHTIQLVHDFLTKKGIPSAIINGQVSVNKRHSIIQRFQEEDDIHVLIIQPQAASHGLTLTSANVVIWYSPVTSVETYLQANARINRPGQVNPMTIVHIRGSAVESKLYNMLQNNIDIHTKIIDLYHNEIEDVA